MLVEWLSGPMCPLKTWALNLHFTLVFSMALTITTASHIPVLFAYRALSTGLTL